MAENIEIQIQDKIAPSISTKLRSIAADARAANTAVQSLQSQLNKISASTGLQRLQTELAKTAVQQQKLATETNKTNSAYLASEAALNRAVAAEQRAATATAQLSAAQAKAATEAQRLATEQQRTSQAYLQSETALNRVVTAETNAATAAQRLSTAQQQTAAATTRAGTAQIQGATAAQRLAAAQRQTATQTANAAAASSRAALAALRLSQAQQRAAQSTGRATSALGRYIRVAAGIAGVTFSANAVLASADAYTTLQNKLQNVTTSQAQVNTLTEELFNLANKTRTGVNETATSFVRFDRALKIMGKSQEDSLRLTETVNKALIVSGATTGEASSSLLQLSQAFNSGRLQGDEFRAVAENMPVILDAIAKATGRPINEIKRMSTEGKITSQVLFDAFKLIQDQVDSTFGKTIPTLAQSFAVFGNNFTKFFGEVNKATGFTAGLSKAIIFLSENLKGAAVVLTGLSTAMLVAFGPSIIAAIGSATVAVKAFTIALLANPLAILIIALTTAIAYFALFRDEINLGIDKVTTLGDFFRATFEGIGQVINDIKFIVGELWASLFDDASSNLDKTSNAVTDSTAHWYDDYSAFFESNRTGWAAAFENTAKVLDAIAGLLTGAAIFAGRAMAEIVITVKNAIATAYNFIASWIETVTNKAIEAANKLRALVGKSAIELINFERMGKAGETEFEGFGKLWAQSLEDGFKSQGGALQGVVNGLFGRAQAIGAGRRSGAQAQLRGAGKSQLGDTVDEKSARAAERRALALEKINAQLDNELSRMFQLQPQREAQAKFDQIEENLIKKKIKLTESEVNSIKSKIKAIQDATEVQKQFDSIYEEAVGPLKEYNATQEAANKLLAMGAITREQAQIAINKASEAFANAKDPMRQYNKDLQDQFAILAELPDKQQVRQQLIQVENELIAAGIPDREKKLLQYKEELQRLEDLNAKNQQLVSIYEATSGRLKEITDAQVAYTEALKNGYVSLDVYNTKLNQLAISAAQTKNAMGFGDSDSIFTASLDGFLSDFVSVATGISETISQMYSSLTDGISNSLASAIVKGEDLRTTLYDLSQTVLTELLSSLIKLGIQYAVNATLGNSVAAASTAGSVALAATTAAAWAPAAAATSLASFGANAAPASAALTSTYALSSILSKVGGFMEGGFTGSIAKDQVAGVVHGQEFVMDAATTSRIGVANLEALRSGAAGIQRTSTNAPQANIETPTDQSGASVGKSQNIRIINTLDPAIIGDYMSAPEGEQILINTLRRNSDQLKAIVNG